ncbi:MFS transporter [Lapillicoccus sp.]|uniref:MFS transporter n=1 Tax=Lapillicoccus sp. TaxID=1909287 RepID=UPI0027C0F68F|nr:MFS transporter [Actinomycetota bacterium]
MTVTESDLVEAQRHTVRTLVVTQAMGGVGLSSAIAVSALLAKDISGSDELAGFVQTGQVLGAAVVSAVLAVYMVRHGRRPGLGLGYLVGALGAVACIVAGTTRSFPMMLTGAVMLGAVTAANNQSRYAATDLARPEHRGRALSTVVWATTIGSVLGPNLTGPGATVARWLHLPDITGSFVFSVVTLLATAAIMLVRLRPDPLLLARSAGPALGRGTENASDRDASGRDASAFPVDAERTFSVIRRTPLVLAAAIGMALTHAVMVSVMVMTPIHMDHGGASLQLIGLVISTHILGMYAFSPFVGLAVDRWGSPPVMGAGGLVLLVALVLAGASSPGASFGLGLGLFLLGLGWSLGTVASSTLLTASAPDRQRPQIQGFVDMTTLFTAAAGGAVAGVVVGTAGFGWLSAGAAVLAFGVVVTAVAAGRHRSEADEHLPGVATRQQ